MEELQNLPGNPTQQNQNIQDSMINFSQIFVCQNTQIFQKKQDQKKLVETGKLSVLIDSQSDLLLLMGSICYGVTSQTVAKYCVYEDQNGKEFIILELQNHLHGNYQLWVKQNIDVLIACLEQKCKVFDKMNETQKEQVINLKQELKVIKLEKQEQVKIQIGLPESEQDATVVKASKYFGKGLYFIGKIVSKGLTAVGGVIANNISPSQQVKFSEGTKQNLKRASNLTSQAFQLTSGVVKSLVNYGKQIAADVVKVEPGNQKIQQYTISRSLKNGAVTGVKVFINIYDGFVEGVDEIQKGAVRGGQHILRKKYGTQAEQALKHVAGGINNAVKIYKLPKDSVKYIFKVEKPQKKQ